MNSRNLIDSVFEAEEAAPAGKEQATVRVELTGTPKSVQKAIQQLARQKPAGVKIKAGGKPVEKEDDAPKPKADEKDEKDSAEEVRGRFGSDYQGWKDKRQKAKDAGKRKDSKSEGKD